MELRSATTQVLAKKYDVGLLAPKAERNEHVLPKVEVVLAEMEVLSRTAPKNMISLLPVCRYFSKQH